MLRRMASDSGVDCASAGAVHRQTKDCWAPAAASWLMRARSAAAGRAIRALER
jgi:hypothetical protein